MLNQWGIWDTVKQSRSLGLHQNNGLELVLLLRGEVVWQVGDQQELIQPGSLFFTLPSDVHGGPGEDHAGIELQFAVFEVEESQADGRRKLVFPAEWGLPESVAEDLSTSLTSARSHQVPASSLMKSVFAELVHGLNDETPESFRHRILGVMVLEELRYCLNHPTETKSSQSSEKVRTFLRDLRQVCEKEWSVDRMAGACELGKSQFTEVVRNLYGHSPMQLLNRMRLEKARHLLRHSDDSITEIAYKCGFNSSQYFATVFRQVYGISPTEFLKNR